MQRQLQLAAGLDVAPDEPVAVPAAAPVQRTERQALPQSVVKAKMANPFLAPDFSKARPQAQGRLSGWELIGPLLNAFEHPRPVHPPA
jgi:hypothetical protein